MSSQLMQDNQGEWGPVVPLPNQPGYDAEVWASWATGRRLLHWQLYRDGDHLVAAGYARTKLGVALALRRAKRRDRKAGAVVRVSSPRGLEQCSCIYPDMDPYQDPSDEDWDPDTNTCACGHVMDEHGDDGQCQVVMTRE